MKLNEMPNPKDLCCGRTDDFSDANAPKFIESTELTKLFLKFNHSTKGMIGSEMSDTAYAFPEGSYFYTLNKNEEGQFVLKKNNEEYPMDTGNVAMLATIMKNSKVVECNGINRITQGLPADVPSYTFKATYASGEEIASSCCPGFGGWFFPIATFLDSYIEGFRQRRPVAPQRGTAAWNCRCGQKNLRVKFCGECGAMSPVNPDGTWICTCGNKKASGNFCGECGSKSPIVR